MKHKHNMTFLLYADANRFLKLTEIIGTFQDSTEFHARNRTASFGTNSGTVAIIGTFQDNSDISIMPIHTSWDSNIWLLLLG